MQTPQYLGQVFWTGYQTNNNWKKSCKNGFESIVQHSHISHTELNICESSLQKLFQYKQIQT